MILAPIIRDRKGEHQHVFEDARRAGFVRVRVDGRIRDLGEEIDLDKKKKHTIEVVVDRLDHGGRATAKARASSASRLADSVEQALKLGGGTVLVDVEGEGERLYSEHYACAFDGTNVGELAPRNFSFNSPHGACPDCTGLGVKMEIDPALVIPNRDISIEDGAIAPWSRAAGDEHVVLPHAAGAGEEARLQAQRAGEGDEAEAPRPRAVRRRGPDHAQATQTSGGHTNRWDTTFEGVIPNLSRRYKETDSDYIRAEIEKYMAAMPCPACKGARLKPETLAVTVADRNIVAGDVDGRARGARLGRGARRRRRRR